MYAYLEATTTLCRFFDTNNNVCRFQDPIFPANLRVKHRVFPSWSGVFWRILSPDRARSIFWSCNDFDNKANIRDKHSICWGNMDTPWIWFFPWQIPRKRAFQCWTDEYLSLTDYLHGRRNFRQKLLLLVVWLKNVNSNIRKWIKDKVAMGPR